MAGIVIGTFLKYAAIIATLSSVFGILNAVIVNSVTIQQILTTSLGVVGAQAGVTTGAITGLSGALATMGQIIKAQLLLTVKSLGGALLAAGAAIKTGLLIAAKAVGGFLIFIAPLVIKIGLVVGAAILFTKAIREVGKELGPLAGALVDAFLPLSSLDKGFKDSAKSSRSFAESMKELTGGLARTITTLASLVKLMVVGLATSITIVNRGILKMRLMLADAGEETRILKAALKDNSKAMTELSKSSQVAQAGLFTFGNESVIAMEKVAQYGKAVAEAGDKIDKAGDHGGKIKRSAEEIAKSIEALQLANKNLRLEIDLVGAGQIQTLMMRATFEKGILGDKIKQLTAEKSLKEVAELRIQQGLIDKKLAADVAQLRASSAKSQLEANQQLADQITLIGLEGKNLADVTLQLELEKIQAKKDQLRDEGLLLGKNSDLEKSLDHQAKLLQMMADSKLRQGQIAFTEQLTQKQKELQTVQDMVGLEGEDLAEAQLALEIAKVNAASARAKIEGTLTQDALDAAEEIKASLTALSEGQNMSSFMVAATAFAEVLGEGAASAIDVLSDPGAIKGIATDLMDAAKNFGTAIAEAPADIGNFFADFDASEMFAGLEDIDSGDIGQGIEDGAKSLAEAGETAGSAISSAGGSLMDFGGDMLDSIIGFAGQASENFGLKMQEASQSLIQGFENLPDFAMTMVDSGIEMMNQMVARAPEVIQGMIDALPGIIDKLAEAFAGLLDALPAIFGQLAEALPGIITKIMDTLPQLIQKIFMAIPQIVAQLMSAIPDIFVAILEGLPEIISAVIEGFIGAMGEIIGSFIDTFITKGGALKMAIALVKGIVQSLGAIVTGISKGIQRALKGIFSGFEIPPFAGEKLIKNLQTGMKKVITGLTGATEQAFGVIDIPTGGKAKKELENVGDQIQDAIKLAGKSVAGLWDSFLAALKKLWMWIWTMFDKFIIQPIKKVWLFVWNLLSPFVKALKEVWLFVWKNVLEPIIKNLTGWYKAVFDTFNNVVKLLGSWYKAVWDTFRNVLSLLTSWYKAVWDTFTNVLSLLTSWYKAVWDTFRNVVQILVSWYKAVWDTFRNVVNIFTDWLSALWQTFQNVVGIFKEAWNVIINFFQQIFKGNVKEAFQGVFDFFAKLPEMVINAFKPVFDFWDTLGPKLMAAFKPIFDFFGSLGSKLVTALKPITDFLSNIGGAVASAFKPITDFFGGLKGIFSEAFKPLTNFFNADAIGNILKKAFNISPIGLLFNSDAIKGFIQKAINLLNPGTILKKLFNIDSGLPSLKPGGIESLIGLDLPYAKFAQGGVVPGTAPTKGDSLLNDKILAMLSPGEFVVPRSIAMMPGMSDFLAQLIKTGGLPQLGLGGVVKSVTKSVSKATSKAVDSAISQVSSPTEFNFLNKLKEEAENRVGSDPLGGIGSSTEKAIGDIGAAGKKALDDTVSALERLGIPDPIEYLKREFGGAMRKMLEANKFAEGGPTGDGGPALLHPGEFVLRQSAVQGIGQSQAEFINSRGRLPQGDTKRTQNVTIVFEPGSIAMQGIQDPDRFVDQLIDTMKRRGIDGDFVMSSSGLRETS
ncbi:MAG TPA: hypothetical protein VMW45_03155 [Dehalococcoidia bacterium]|nr:hypothetical protein [Dehalococcoidia bacterium]